VHELSLAGAVVDTVVKHADGRPVSVVRLSVGQMRQVVPDSLDFYFGFVSKATVCEGATLEQNLITVRLRCPSCGREWGPEKPVFRCSDCDGIPATVLAGEEFAVDSIVISRGHSAA
jgi:hydrogenase nickel incorporation protein HypA/HybF